MEDRLTSLITSILTGGSQNHETTSEEANATYTDFVSEGIVGSVGNTSGVAPATGGLAVNAQGTPDMTVEVGTGVAYVTGTPTSQNSQTFRIKNSASENVTISANASGSTKYDWLYLKLDATNLNTPNTAGDNVATLVTSRSSSAASDDGTPPTYGYPLAVITVANGASSITNGNIRDVRSQVALNTGTSNAVDGWTALSGTPTVSTGYNKGNREYDLTFASSMASILSPGMRLKVTRAETPPTQCADLEASSSQYASKTSPTGITFTDDFTCEAWVKLESYARGIIVSRSDGASGFGFEINASGQVRIFGDQGANLDDQVSYQSIPLGRWVHVAASMDCSGNSFAIYIDGVSVPVQSVSTTATAIVQAGNLQVGAFNGSIFFDGKIADVRVWSAIRTATEIRDNMNQQLVGNETNLVAYFKLNGDFNDSTSNANNLTASGGAAATDADNPMKATEYAIVTKVATTTVTVFTGTDYNIPNMTLSTPYYSTQKAPFGFPADKGKWIVQIFVGTAIPTSGTTGSTYYNPGGLHITVPLGRWNIFATLSTQFVSDTTTHDMQVGMSSTTTAFDDHQWVRRYAGGVSAGTIIFTTNYNFFVENSATANYYPLLRTGASVTGMDLRKSSVVTAECAYV